MMYAGILIVILALVAAIVRWYNLPRVVEARAKAADQRRDDIAARKKARQDEQDKKRQERQDRRDNRRNQP